MSSSLLIKRQNDTPVPMLTNKVKHDVCLQWDCISYANLADVTNMESICHSHPWSEGNFRDCIKTAGFYLPIIKSQHNVLGYMVAMLGVEETHLLNITVSAQARRQGLGSVFLQSLKLWSLQNRAQQIWLEVRQSNLPAKALYQAHGFKKIALRKNYYPLDQQKREHALVMCCQLDATSKPYNLPLL